MTLRAASGPSTYRLTRQVFLRLLSVVYLTAFASLWTQSPGLIGTRGLLPAAAFLDRIHELTGAAGFWIWPTLA